MRELKSVVSHFYPRFLVEFAVLKVNLANDRPIILQELIHVNRDVRVVQSPIFRHFGWFSENILSVASFLDRKLLHIRERTVQGSVRYYRLLRLFYSWLLLFGKISKLSRFQCDWKLSVFKTFLGPEILLDLEKVLHLLLVEFQSWYNVFIRRSIGDIRIRNLIVFTLLFLEVQYFLF